RPNTPPGRRLGRRSPAPRGPRRRARERSRTTQLCERRGRSRHTILRGAGGFLRRAYLRLIESVTVVVWVRAPLVPVIVSVRLPFLAEEVTMFSVVLPVAGFGLNDAVTPAGR